MAAAKRSKNKGKSGRGRTRGAAPAVPDEMSSAQAKDQISDVVKKAFAGGRTTILSRGYAIGIIGPLHDVPPSAERDALRLPTTEIKSGQTSMKGTLARGDYAILTIHGEDRAAVYRPNVRRQPAQTEDKLERLIDLLDESALVERENRRALDESVRLRRFVDALHAEIAGLLDALEKIDPARAAQWRTRCADLTHAREAARG
jgi:hypothetical protein